MAWRETATRHDRLQRELTEERAAAVLRISRRLEALISELHAIRERIGGLDDDQRQRERSSYQAVRNEAVKYRWFLEVQREAMGLRDHRGLDEFYRLPPAEP
jgi:hypothetical protein